MKSGQIGTFDLRNKIENTWKKSFLNYKILKIILLKPNKYGSLSFLFLGCWEVERGWCVISEREITVLTLQRWMFFIYEKKMFLNYSRTCLM